MISMAIQDHYDKTLIIGSFLAKGRPAIEQPMSWNSLVFLPWAYSHHGLTLYFSNIKF